MYQVGINKGIIELYYDARPTKSQDTLYIIVVPRVWKTRGFRAVVLSAYPCPQAQLDYASFKSTQAVQTAIQLAMGGTIESPEQCCHKATQHSLE